MKKLLALFTICVLTGSVVCAQQTGRKKSGGEAKVSAGRLPNAKPAPYLPAVPKMDDVIDRVFDKYVEAQGGTLMLMGIKSRIMRGSVENSKAHVPGKFESYFKSPGKSLLLIDVPGTGQFIEAFDGRDGWFRTPYTGTSLMDDSSSEERKRSAPSHFAMSYRDLFSSIKYKGESKEMGREVYLIEATPVGRTPQLMYFDKRDGLLWRVDHLPAGGNVNNLLSLHVEKYAKVDGVQLPIKFKQVYKEFTLTFNVYEVKHNVAIQDAMFDNPKAISSQKGH